MASETLVSVDPGIRGCGVALFRDGRLVAAEYVKNPVKKGNDFDAIIAVAQAAREWVGGRAADRGDLRLVLEWPKVYTASKSKGDNNDLLALCAVDAAIVALVGARATKIIPRDWKGTMAHEAVVHRVYSRLDSEGNRSEWNTLADAEFRAGKTYGHNVVDAVGIGLHALGRFTPRKVIAR